MSLTISHIHSHTSLAPIRPTSLISSWHIQCENMLPEVSNQEKDTGYGRNSIIKDYQGKNDPSSHPVWRIPTTTHYYQRSSQTENLRRKIILPQNPLRNWPKPLPQLGMGIHMKENIKLINSHSNSPSSSNLQPRHKANNMWHKMVYTS